MKINYSVKPPFRGQAEDQRKFSLNRSVPSVMVTDTKMKEKFTSLDPRLLPLKNVLLRQNFPK